MKKITMGILAHVDSGKTTLSEAILYKTGVIRTLGRVDFKDTFLDTEELEKERKITIFSKQARFSYNDITFNLIDTPGHIDFSQETERALSVLDVAVLLVSASGELQAHTEALFKVLEKYSVPVFVFINKIDLDTAQPQKIFNTLKKTFKESFINFNNVLENNLSDTEKESIAECSEDLLSQYLSGESFSKESITHCISKRKMFPVLFGSALKGEGIDTLLDAISKYFAPPLYDDVFGAKIYKISLDEQGKKLAHAKITGKSISVKDMIAEEKISEIRIYSGDKYKSVQTAEKGDICALVGLKDAYSGQGLGKESDSIPLSFQPLFMHKVEILDKTDIPTALKNLKKLEEEDPTLKVVYNKALSGIYLKLMGTVQAEVLIKQIKTRFNMDISFSKGDVFYKETIKGSSYGVGHFEPLRHYAEVHLLLEEGKRGSGLKFFSDLSEDVLDKNWQRLILTHLQEKEHKGVLTGFPITDMKITLKNGKAHEKHTEGGDFREATYRAVRHGLMNAESIILEPWLSFKITVPTENSGRVMMDIENMGGTLSSPDTDKEWTILKGSAPLVLLSDYDKELLSITHGKGKISLSSSGYLPVKNQDEVKEKIGYSLTLDTENPCGSVFCAKGASFLVPYEEVFSYMHLEKCEKKEEIFQQEENLSLIKNKVKKDVSEEDLMKIYENTYGKITPKTSSVPKEVKIYTSPLKKHKPKNKKNDKSYLLIDGYNMLFAWNNFNDNIDTEGLNLAKNNLIERLSNISTALKDEMILVFDAYKVKGGQLNSEKIGALNVIHTKEAQTADSFIEKCAKELSKNYTVRVATSDRLEQIIIFGSGATRISEKEFLRELSEKEAEIKDIISKKNTPIYQEHKIKTQ